MTESARRQVSEIPRSRLLLKSRSHLAVESRKEWDDNGIILFEEFCTLIRTPQRTVREWRRRNRGPTWHRFNGNGRLYITVAELRRFLRGGR